MEDSETLLDDHARTLWQPLLQREQQLGTNSTARQSYRPAEHSNALPGSALPGALTLPAPSQPSMVPSDSMTTVLPHLDTSGSNATEVEEIGAGGMGTIYKSVQRSLARPVAVKILKGDVSRTGTALFISEAQVTGRLEHPNIVPIHSLGGIATGRPHLTMKLIKGHVWRDLVLATDDRARPLKEHLRTLLTVCHAVAFAHTQGIIHRDLKLENVMVGEFGQVYVMDWGLAACLPGAHVEDLPIARATELIHPAGTPGYMAPELALGRGYDQDERTDVYLLGGCLHEVLTRNLRHTGATLEAVLHAAVASLPFAYDPSVPRELAQICNRSMARAPKDRFQSVAEFRQALEGFFEHEHARSLTASAIAKLTRMQELSDGLVKQGEAEVHRLYTEIHFALEQSLESWPESTEAQAALTQCRRVMLRFALSVEDLPLARRLSPFFDDAELLASVDALAERLASNARE